MNKPKYKFIDNMNMKKLRVLIELWVEQGKDNKEIYKLSKVFFKLQPDKRTLQYLIRCIKIKLRDKPFMDDLKRWKEEISDHKEQLTEIEEQLEEMFNKRKSYMG